MIRVHRVGERPYHEHETAILEIRLEGKVVHRCQNEIFEEKPAAACTAFTETVFTTSFDPAADTLARNMGATVILNGCPPRHFCRFSSAAIFTLEKLWVLLNTSSISDPHFIVTVRINLIEIWWCPPIGHLRTHPQMTETTTWSALKELAPSANA